MFQETILPSAPLEPPMDTISVMTFGCRLNLHESEVMRKLAIDANLGDTVIVNTCAVTGEAERQARQAIRKLARQSPDKKIIVTGCAAQTNKDSFMKLTNVVAVIGNAEKTKSQTFLDIKGHISLGSDTFDRVGDIFAPDQKEDLITKSPTLVSSFKGLARGFIEIQNGCNHRCTFCKIPYGRGNSRSVPLGVIVANTRHLMDQGYQEIVLTGVDLTAYGEDLPGTPTLGQSTSRLLSQLPKLPRLRLSSLDPSEIDDRLYELFQNESRLMPHVHLSMQAGDPLILKRMKRRHNPQDLRQTCDRLRELRDGVVFGADVIAGFPTETDDMFENTFRLIQELNIIYLHVFPYSPRAGTPAARMPQVEKSLIKERAQRLRDLGKQLHLRYLENLVGTTQEILVESPTKGRTPGYASVDIEPCLQVGTLMDVRVDEVCPKTLSLKGQIISPPKHPSFPKLNYEGPTKT